MEPLWNPVESFAVCSSEKVGVWNRFASNVASLFMYISHYFGHTCCEFSRYYRPSARLHYLHSGNKVLDWSQCIQCSRWFLLMQKLTELWEKLLPLQHPHLLLYSLFSFYCFLIFACSWGFPAKMDTIIIGLEETGLQVWNSQQYLAMFLCGKTKV